MTRSTYSDIITFHATRANNDSPVTVKWIVREPKVEAPAPSSSVVEQDSTSFNQLAESCGLLSSLSFENFVQGMSNKVALGAATYVANNPGTKAFNPLYIYGGVGLGKTHLMHAIGLAVLKRNPKAKILCLSATTYIAEFLKGIARKDQSFYQRFKSLDLLLLDDVQMLGSKEGTQSAFFSTFEALVPHGKQIVLTSDTYAKQLKDVDERLKSRFAGGMSVPIDPPELETREAILMKKAEQSGTNLPEDVAFFIANPLKSNVRELEGAVKAGTLSEADINARAAEVAKIAAATKLVGVGRNDLLKDDIAAAHHDVARKVAEGSSVLLKNDNATLPFKAGTRVAVIGDMAATARYQGSGSSKVNATKEENILEEVKNAEGLVLAGYEQGYDRQGKADRVLVEDAVALAGKESVDVVLAVVGLDERSESEGLDRSTMAIPQVQNDLVEALKGAGKPIVVVLVAGSPVELPWIDDVAAVLYVGLSGQAGASATVRALTGEINPSGHLAETWPMHYEDCPSSGWYPAIGRDAIYREGPFVGYRYYETAGVPVRFPFGYGLSYSTFTYSAATAGENGIDVMVSNDSDVAGSTVVQLYVRGPQGGVLRPDRELKGFAKVSLAAHESKSVHIDFDRYTFRHFDVASNEWKTETGEWTLMVGDNAEHLPLTIPHTVAGDVNPVAADTALGHYLSGHVKEVTDAEMAVLFGHEVVAPGKPVTFGVNDPIMSWVDSKGFVARTVAKTLTKQEAKIRQKTGAPDLNTLFILNMPPRAMSKMTQGMVDSAMVDAIVKIANGHTFRGLGGVIAGFFRNQSANKRTAKELNND